jgi:uncharacterized damage-inducible protein DinB
MSSMAAIQRPDAASNANADTLPTRRPSIAGSVPAQTADAPSSRTSVRGAGSTSPPVTAPVPDTHAGPDPSTAATATVRPIGDMLNRGRLRRRVTMPFTRSLVLGITVAAVATPVFAQTNPATAAAKAQFGMISGSLTKTAEKVPENLYTFKATPEVRSIAQLIGHVADSQFGICASAAGEKPPQSGIEKSKTSKADLSKALADSIAYCNTVFDGMNDQKGMEVTKFFTGPTPRLFVLAFNTAHSNEHYGNLVTYMRLNKIVPPSSEGQK